MKQPTPRKGTETDAREAVSLAVRNNPHPARSDINLRIFIKLWFTIVGNNPCVVPMRFAEFLLGTTQGSFPTFLKLFTLPRKGTETSLRAIKISACVHETTHTPQVD